VAGAGRILVSLFPQSSVAIDVKTTSSILAVSLKISLDKNLKKPQTYNLALVPIALPVGIHKAAREPHVTGGDHALGPLPVNFVG